MRHFEGAWRISSRANIPHLLDVMTRSSPLDWTVVASVSDLNVQMLYMLALLEI